MLAATTQGATPTWWLVLVVVGFGGAYVAIIVSGARSQKKAAPKLKWYQSNSWVPPLRYDHHGELIPFTGEPDPRWQLYYGLHPPHGIDRFGNPVIYPDEVVDGPRPDPTLDLFRRGVAELTNHGTVVGHLATTVAPYWAPKIPLRVAERVWLQITWADGRREPLFDDHPPWKVVPGLRDGRLVRHAPQQDEEVLDVRWLDGQDRKDAWRQWGFPTVATEAPPTPEAPESKI